MKDLLILDWRAFVKNISYSVLNGRIACTWPTEKEEIGHRVMKRLYSLYKDFPDHHFVIANDVRPYWRYDYIKAFYESRGLPPVTYKGNRDNVSWPFQTPSEEMEGLYAALRHDACVSLGATLCQDAGLEADDIWGILAATSDCKVVGVSVDSDWAQLIDAPRVKIFDFSKNAWMEKADIRAKWIGGDSGDNIKGCPKTKKDGTPMKNGWGYDGAVKLLENENWAQGLDEDHLEKNWALTTLPCPLWDLQEAEESLAECSEAFDQVEDVWDTWGVTAPVRKILDSKAERDAWIAKVHNWIAEVKAKGND